MSPYLLAYIAIIIVCVIITPYIHFKLHGYKADTFKDYNTVVLGKVAGTIIEQKNNAYGFNNFFSSGNIDFSQNNLINHNLSLADIACITSDTPLNTCNSLQINDVSIPRTIENPRYSRFVCSNREYGLIDTGNNMYKVRILNYDYLFNRCCINLVINNVETVGNRILLRIKNDMAAQLLVMLRPQFITMSMCYLYKVIYENDPFYYGPNTNSPRHYNSTHDDLNLLLEKNSDDRVYAQTLLIDLQDIHKYEDLTKDIKCSKAKMAVEYTNQEHIAQHTPTFMTAVTVYHHRLVGKMPMVSVDITNSMALYFDIDLRDMERFKTDTTLFHMMRSATGKANVCKTIAIKIRNDAIKCVNIILDEMSALTYTFELPTESMQFKMFVLYTLDLIIVCAFYLRGNGVQAFKYVMYDTSIISSWSLSDIAAATRTYKCALPTAAEPATSYCIPTFYDMLSKLQLI